MEHIIEKYEFLYGTYKEHKNLPVDMNMPFNGYEDSAIKLKEPKLNMN